MVPQHLRKNFHYYQCHECDLIFLEPSERLSARQELARYQHHDNSSEDSGYLKFLQPIVDLIKASYLSRAELSSLRGLDFGSGPKPVLSGHLQQLGILMSCYDLYFHQDQLALRRKYDFVVSTEVIEHLYFPAIEIGRLQSLLRPEGKIFLMTQLHQGPEHFSSWWYPRDPTHVCFYSRLTMQWLADQFDLRLLSCDDKSLVSFCLKA